MIAVFSHDRPQFLKCCLASIKAFNPEWWNDVIVFDDDSGQPVDDVIEKYGVKVVKHKCDLEKTRQRSSNNRIVATRYANDKYPNESDAPILFVDDDIVVGPGALTMMAEAFALGEYDAMTGLHLLRFSKRGKGHTTHGFTLHDLSRMGEAFFVTSPRVFNSYDCSWFPTKLFFNSIRERGKWLGFLRGVPVQHVGAWYPIISKHIHNPAALLLIENDEAVQPIPGYEIKFNDIDFDKLEAACNVNIRPNRTSN